VLVEGVSDQTALETLIARVGDPDERLAVVPIGGAHGMLRMLRAIRARYPRARLSGLYDLAEAGIVGRALTDLGIIARGPELDDARRLPSRRELEDAGFFACDADLEDELLRACGASLVEECLARNGDLRAFRRLQGQPQWREQQPNAQLHRWIASGARRKVRYARILVEAVPLERMPRPLVAVLTSARQA
jgi:hypothetical protein